MRGKYVTKVSAPLPISSNWRVGPKLWRGKLPHYCCCCSVKALSADKGAACLRQQILNSGPALRKRLGQANRLTATYKSRKTINHHHLDSPAQYIPLSCSIAVKMFRIPFAKMFGVTPLKKFPGPVSKSSPTTCFTARNANSRYLERM